MTTNTIVKQRTYVDELNELCQSNGGLLEPEHVVDYAADPNTMLHSKFTWDNDAASHLWRLHQARNLIRVVVTVEKSTQSVIRAFVSLSSDREEGGYRAMVSVLNNKAMRQQMLEDAKRELIVFRDKYSMLKELSKVFEAIDSI